MFRMIRPFLLLLTLTTLPVSAADLEAEVRAIEQLALTAPRQESDARIKALSPQRDALTPEQHQRLDYIRLRNLSLGGNGAQALQGLEELLKQDLAPALRSRVYATAISIAGNVEDWKRAFGWLNDALASMLKTPEESVRLLGVASYLYSLVGETGKSRELALRMFHEVESGNDAAMICRALGSVALAEDHADNYRVAKDWRHRQVEACSRAGDRVFIANGKYGIGKMESSLGRHTEALRWARQALAEFETAGYVTGAYGARLVIAQSLIELNRSFGEAQALLDDALRYYRQQNTDYAVAEAENLLARLSERLGDPATAVAHLNAAMVASAAAERAARERQLAFLRVQFDTKLKEQQITHLQTERELAELQVTATQRRQWLLFMGMGGLLVTAILLSIVLRRSIRERQRYRWQSHHDSLTRLYNYQQVRKLGEAAFMRALASGRSFTAIVIDIDHFKEVNDHYGHAAGDLALRSLGAWISEATPAGAIAGRSGGDEFTLLLEGDTADAEALLKRLRGLIKPVTVFGQTFRISISSGVCQVDDQGATLEQLIHAADQALYRAKHEGRNRVVCVGNEAAAVASASAGLVVVGSGIQFGRHVSERCLSEIRIAEMVLCLVDPFALGMIRRIRPDAVNLGLHYAPGKDRRETYREIDAAIMAEVRAGRHVCAVFYGHPGVFADVPHAVVRKARAEGFPARMEPGISAEACLYADLGINPGHRGVQSMEATQFLYRDRQPDPAGLVLIWQVALAGDLSCRRLHAERDGLQALVDKLLRWYPPDHEVILYEAAQLPIAGPRADRLALRDLPSAHYEEATTLLIPPLGELRDDPRHVPRAGLSAHPEPGWPALVSR